MKNTIYLVDIEFIPNRYSCEWKTEFPKFLRSSLEEYDVVVIDGRENVPEAVTEGAFINFGGTNIYKSDQIAKLAELFTLDVIEDGDHIIFADAWHPGIINVKYMAELLNKQVYLHGLWHAGSYDKWDFLGRIIGNKPWINSAEKSFYHCYDYNWFATNFHVNMFLEGVFSDNSHLINPGNRRTIWHKTGWPMEYTKNLIEFVEFENKENIIVYPHRLAPEKRIDLFKKFSEQEELAGYKFVIPMEMNLSKSEYHDLLKKSKFVISFAEQETLGISVFEGLCAGCIPIVPNRLSYQEMYPDWFKINCDSDDQMIAAAVEFISFIENDPNNLADLSAELKYTRDAISKEFFSATKIIETIKNV